jgi:hypothetical protein
MHRVVMRVNEDAMYDHINHDKLDNRKENLRLATSTQNNRNRRKRSDTTTSQYKGVSWHGRSGKWQVHIRVNGKGINLGYFILELDAAYVYDKAARYYFGEFAYTNFS